MLRTDLLIHFQLSSGGTLFYPITRYEIHEQREQKWGIPTNGVYNGMMGELQREESDFTTIASPTPLRLQLLEYMRGYPADVIVVVSLQPSLLPENLALVRPFSGELWLAVVVSVFAWGTILWLLQKAWRRVAGGREVKLNIAIFYGWGALMEEPPAEPSVNVSGQVLVGWWLVFCLVICTGYRSSLISHLTVKGKSRTLETFQDLLDQKNWKWGTERWVLSGNPLEYFSKNTDPVVKQIYNEIESASQQVRGQDMKITNIVEFSRVYLKRDRSREEMRKEAKNIIKRRKIENVK
ncbi:glutamate receptor ionotropic, delta-1-like [Panulirus ornatus]|uniref:glutamate receptor ionotropic, delta-1-like n=1 Tax=Panulirus ornatus TaxID=150431 RepID=UPI003A895C0F